MQQQWAPLVVPDTFGDSANALAPETATPLQPAQFQCSRTVTARKLSGIEDGSMTTVRVEAFPKDWKAATLFDAFRHFGPITSVRIHSKRIARSRIHLRWATITFAESTAATHAAEGGEVLVRRLTESAAADLSSGDMGIISDCVQAWPFVPPLQRANVGSIVHLEGAQQASSAEVGGDDGAVESEQELLQTSMELQDDNASADVLVACLRRADFLESCHGVITRMMDVLATPPRNRTLAQLQLVQQMLANTDLMRRLSSSTLIQRNCCRFLGIATANTREIVFKKRGTAGQLFVVVTGHVDIFDSPGVQSDPPLRCGPGDCIGGESFRSREKERYEQEAVAVEPVVLAVLQKADYFRICDTQKLQQIIDKFFELAARASKDQESSSIDFSGYKQIYLRLGKVITTTKMFSQKELRDTMKEDWDSDLATFGDPDVQRLTHDQYSHSLYQFIDEWSAAIESMELYESLLEMILDEISFVKSDGSLVLKPIKRIKCCYQRLMDMRSEHCSKAKQYQLQSKVGQGEVTGAGDTETVAHFKGLLAKKGIYKSVSRHVGEEHAADEERALSLREVLDREAEYIKEMFDEIDEDHSGTIDRAEVGKLSKVMGWELSSDELDAAISEMDPSGDGEVDLLEFTAWVRRYTEDDELVRSVFQLVDADGSGVLGEDEVEELLQELGQVDGKVEDAMAAMDGDGNGNVDVEEFIAWWRGYNTKQLLLDATPSPDPLAEYYRNMFNRADRNGDGEIDADELEELLRSLGMAQLGIAVQLAMAVMDDDQDGSIQWQEFERWFASVVASETLSTGTGLDLLSVGELGFAKAHSAVVNLCNKQGTEPVSEETLRQAFPPTSSRQRTEPSVSFSALVAWWIAHQSEAGGQEGSLEAEGVAEQDEEESDGEPYDDAELGGWESDSVSPREGTGPAAAPGGAGQVWTEEGWQPVGHQISSRKPRRRKRPKRAQKATKANASDESGPKPDVPTHVAEPLKTGNGAVRENRRQRRSRRSHKEAPAATPEPVPQSKPRPKAVGPTRHGLARSHSSAYRSLPSAPYAHVHNLRVRGDVGQVIPSNSVTAANDCVVASDGGAASDRPPAQPFRRKDQVEWLEQDVTYILQEGNDYVVRMPPVAAPCEKFAAYDSSLASSDSDDDGVCSGPATHVGDNAVGLLPEDRPPLRRVLSDDIIETVASRMEGSTAVDRPQELLEEDFAPVHWDFSGPAVGHDDDDDDGHWHSRSGADLRAQPGRSGRMSRNAGRGQLRQLVRDRSRIRSAGLTVDGASPRGSPRASPAEAQQGGGSSQKRHREVASSSAMLDHAQVVTILSRSNQRRMTNRPRTVPTFGALGVGQVAPGAVAARAPWEAKRPGSHRKDLLSRGSLSRKSLAYFAKHGSARNLISPQPSPRPAFDHDWRSPARMPWRLAEDARGAGRRSSGGRSPRRPTDGALPCPVSDSAEAVAAGRVDPGSVWNRLPRAASRGSALLY